MANIRDIEGIGDSFAGKLEAAGVVTAEALLNKGGSAKGREALAAATGISEKLILRWVNHADLFRLKGVKGQFAELLEAAGVDSVAELAQHNAANLHDKLEAANAERKLVGRIPAASEIESWIAEAKMLPKAVSH